MNPIHLRCTTIEDAWYQSLYALHDFGRETIIEHGSYASTTIRRKQLDWLSLHLTHPGDSLPKLPEQHSSIPPPLTEEDLANYLAKFFDPTPLENEQYTYGHRLFSGEPSQYDRVCNIYRLARYTNQAILQVANVVDITLPDPPCLRHIDTQIIANHLHFYPYFRSWDIWAGMPLNLIAIRMLQEIMADDLGVFAGEIFASCAKPHIYSYVWEYVAILRGV